MVSTLQTITTIWQTPTPQRRRGCLRHLDSMLWPWPLTTDIQNLIRSSIGAVEYSLQVSSRLIKPFMRYHGIKICPDWVGNGVLQRHCETHVFHDETLYERPESSLTRLICLFLLVLLWCTATWLRCDTGRSASTTALTWLAATRAK